RSGARVRDHTTVLPRRSGGQVRCLSVALASGTEGTGAPVAERHVDHLLIGGGLAAGNCARWLREEGGEGSILLVGREPDLPYNRPPCSKEYLRGAESREEVLFRPPEWYEEQKIEALTKVSVTKLDLDARRAELS